MLEIDQRLDVGRVVFLIVYPASLIIIALTISPIALLPLAAGPILATAPKLLPRLRRPEYLLFGALMAAALSLAIATSFTGGLTSPVIFWIAMIVMGVPARFGPRGGIVAIAITLATLFGLTELIHPGQLAHHLPLVIALCGSSAIIAAYSIALARAEFDHRNAALLDPLTGLLNRGALEPRFDEIRQQAMRSDAWVSVVACDIDHFKAVNDVHGHAVGDAVLRDIAYELRHCTRSFELIYRLGGEEFLIVLPGVQSGDAAELAEQLRQAVQDARPSGIDVTCSFGVAAGQGDQVALEPLFRQADQALYASKARGRNCVSGTIRSLPTAEPPPDLNRRGRRSSQRLGAPGDRMPRLPH